MSNPYRRLTTKEKQDIAADDRKFEAAQLLIRLHNRYREVERQYGIMSPEAKAAFDELEEATKHYNRIRKR